MKEKSHSNATFAITYLFSKESLVKTVMNRHVASVHEEKEPFKFDIVKAAVL